MHEAYAHNEYLQTIAEVGVPGLFLLLGGLGRGRVRDSARASCQCNQRGGRRRRRARGVRRAQLLRFPLARPAHSHRSSRNRRFAASPAVCDHHPRKARTMKFWIARMVATLVLGAGTAYAAPQVPFLGFAHHGHGSAVGHHSQPVGDHSKPCPTPHGCAIGRGGPVGDRSKPCPTPHRFAIGNDRFVGDRSKPCPTPHGHGPDGHGPDGHDGKKIRRTGTGTVRRSKTRRTASRLRTSPTRSTVRTRPHASTEPHGHGGPPAAHGSDHSGTTHGQATVTAPTSHGHDSQSSSDPHGHGNSGSPGGGHGNGHRNGHGGN